MHSLKNIIRKWIYQKLDKEESSIRQEFDSLKAQHKELQSELSSLANRISIETANSGSLLQKKFFLLLTCQEYLHQYHTKQRTKDYTDHYVSYCYEAPVGLSNIGDYIQTIATEEAIRHCVGNNVEQVKFETVQRNRLTSHQGGTCVMQGWYEHQQLTFLPGPDTRPVWVGTHFCSEAREMIRCLLENSSSLHFKDIGCRDKSTMAFCQSLGITAYFSRCLTLTLPKRNTIEAQNANTVYIVDCTDEIIEYLPTDIKKEAKILSQRNYKFESWMDWRQSRTVAEQLLSEYKQNARLVVTTALHCAQPCLAMGIPVVFIHPEYNEEDRFSSMDGILKQYSLKDLKEGKVRFDEDAPDIEDLKIALLCNLGLSLKENLSDEEKHEITKVRAFIEQYNSISNHNENTT